MNQGRKKEEKEEKVVHCCCAVLDSLAAAASSVGHERAVIVGRSQEECVVVAAVIASLPPSAGHKVKRYARRRRVRLHYLLSTMFRKNKSLTLIKAALFSSSFYCLFLLLLPFCLAVCAVRESGIHQVGQGISCVSRLNDGFFGSGKNRLKCTYAACL